MQLNSLNSNSSFISQHQFAIYDHKLAVVNNEVLVYGKNFFNYSMQTPLHALNLITLQIRPVYTLNAPVFQDFIMFFYENYLYLWGKTGFSQKGLLYEFDGIKFSEIDQGGLVPRLVQNFSYTKFSHRYVILFSCLAGVQFLNKWYLFDIKQRYWKQILADAQIPICQKSHLIWKNGRGYLLLQHSYNPKYKNYSKNLFYQIKFHNLINPTIQLTPIPFSDQINQLDVVFTHLFTIDDTYLMILGGEEINPSNQEIHLCQEIQQVQKQNKNCHQGKTNFEENKLIFKFDLESFQWSRQYRIAPIKGHNFQIFTFNSVLYSVGGTISDTLIRNIQFYDLNKVEQSTKFSYEQSICYYCDSAFTYRQKLLYEPVIEEDHEIFAPKYRLENKFWKKLSQTVPTELHAIGILCDCILEQKSFDAQIYLCQGINLQAQNRCLKIKIQNELTQVLVLKSKSFEGVSLKFLEAICNASNDQNQDFLSLENSLMRILRLKLAGFKLGVGVLCVFSTPEDYIFVSYSSYSSTDFPDTNFRSYSDIYYMMRWNKQDRNFQCSSQNKRRIIYQNVKTYFGAPEDYQSIDQFQLNQKKYYFANIYVINVENLEKCVTIDQETKKCQEDLKIKYLPLKNPTNSFRSYLRHFYLWNSQRDFSLTLLNEECLFVNIYEKFQSFAQSKHLKEISITDDANLKKVENEQTHFSTNQDQIISWKKIDLVQSCKIYDNTKGSRSFKTNLYNLIFIYHRKRLLKTVLAKKSVLCGVIELIDSVQVQLNGVIFTHLSEERRVMKWIQQISNGIIQQNCPIIEDV